jgi:hypothetical protein
MYTLPQKKIYRPFLQAFFKRNEEVQINTTYFNFLTIYSSSVQGSAHGVV